MCCRPGFRPPKDLKLDDHGSWQRAYAVAMGRQWVERALIAVLVLAIALCSYLVHRKWTSRYEHVFRPVAGLSYEPPQAMGGAAVSDISEPLTFQRLSASDAFRFNASVPVSTDPIINARPFILPAALPAADAVRALDCLTAAVYYEAASEGAAGQLAVAQVVLNRVRHRAFPNSVCGVVFSGSTRTTGCQFTFTCDGALGRKPSPAGWARARAVARAALSGQVSPLVGQATHYHTLWVAPYWSPSLDKVANIGAHTFYRWKGPAGRPEAFSAPYAGAEPVFSLTVEAVDTAADTAEASPPPPAIATDALSSPVPALPTPPQVAAAETTEPVRAAPPSSTAATPAAEAPTAPAPAAPAIEPERRRRTATPSW